MATDDITTVNEYTDGYSEEWPYPDEVKISVVTGELADRIRARTGETGEVTIEERVISGGYSESTQENEYTFELRISGSKVWETDDCYSEENGLVKMLAWLDGTV